MEKYRIKVNGSTYEVEVELLSEAAAAVKTETVPSAAPAGDGRAVSAPMPGTILSVDVTVGQKVKKGDVLFILEAMKMENEISAPADGTVTSLSVKKGDAVTSGALLCTIA